MADSYYQPGDQRGAKVNDLFGKIARRYDVINDLQSFGLHRRWKQTVVTLARIKSGERALDVCCGTGDISFALAKAGAVVDGVDFSEAMLTVAKGKKTCANPPNFLCGDAQNLPFPDDTFDIVTVGYGLRNLPSWERGLEEMWRVTKPGGRILVLDFGKPDNAIWRKIYFVYLRNFVPLFGKIFCADSATHAYILESLQNYPAQRGVADKMKTLNGKKVGMLLFLGGAMSINYGEK